MNKVRNEIKQTAIRFSREWVEHCEEAESKSFWDACCSVSGMMA